MDPEYRQRLSEAVRKARGDRSQRKFAKDLRVSYPAVRSWEEGESLPGLENLEAIAGALGVSLEEFLAYLRNEELEAATPKPKIADDLLPLVNRLPLEEKRRLVHLLVDQLGRDNGS
jgi:transcriptional regulator with XRE-family HTH domain